MKALSLLFLFLLTSPCLAKPGPLVVILLPGTSLRDWQAADAPSLHWLMANGALAMMNTRTARLSGDKARETPESALLTLGAGARAAAGADVLPFLPAGTAGALYTRRMGLAAPTRAAVNVGWPALLRANSGRGYDIHPGNLADALTPVGISVRAGGGKFANLVAASGKGTIVPIASPADIPDGCTIWDAGNDIRAANTIVRQVAALTSARQGRLLVISPFTGDPDYANGRRLTPVLEYGEGIPPGLLISPSTRRPGLVTNTDFAPSVAAYFGRTREDFPALPFGSVWYDLPSAGSQRQVSTLERQAYRQAHGMQILPYLAVTLTLWILLGTVLVRHVIFPGWATYVPLIAGFSLLLAGSAVEAGAWVVALTLTALFIASRFGEKIAIAALAGGIVLVLTVDMAAGSHLMRRSLLGYSAVEGARYYGIGNESMGLLIGSSLVIVARVWPVGKTQKVLMLLGLMTVTLLLGSPLAGAKAGGLLVSSIAFGTFIWDSLRGKWSWRVIAALLATTTGIMGAVALGDALLFSHHHSHMGEAVQRIRAGGLAEAADIVTRKLSVEGRLAWHSAWACLLWTGLVCLWWLGRLSPRTPLSVAGFVAISACVLLNDAGVVAASLCLVPLWCEACLQKKKTALGEGYFSQGLETN